VSGSAAARRPARRGRFRSIIAQPRRPESHGPHRRLQARPIQNPRPPWRWNSGAHERQAPRAPQLVRGAEAPRTERLDPDTAHDRQDRLPLPRGPEAGRRRHGCGLQGRGHPPGPPGRAEVPARGAVPEPPVTRAFPARGPGRLRPQPPQHLHRSRHRRARAFTTSTSTRASPSSAWSCWRARRSDAGLPRGL